MNTKLLILLTFSVVMSAFSSCSNDSMNNDEFSDLSNMTGTWVCNPEPNVTITLTFESGKVNVKTSPQVIYMSMTTDRNRVYFFSDGDQYCARKDTLYYVNYIPDTHIENYGFYRTIQTSNQMQLQKFGEGIPFYDNGIYITEYLFKRLKNN